MGLKIGIYSSAGTMTCAKQFGSLGYEEIDAQTYKEWGIDYVSTYYFPLPSTLLVVLFDMPY